MYSKLVFPSIGIGGAKLKINEKMLSLLILYLKYPLHLESEIRQVKCLNTSSS